MSWVLTILGIVLLIVLHELGHFTVAKLVGMRVERFSLFFPPTIARIKRGETEYALGSIPAGGYVKITGMNPEELEDLDPEATRRAYYAQPPWKRIAVILAGPGVNIAIAFALFWAILATGDLNGAAALEGLNPAIQTRVPTDTVRLIERGKPADGVLLAGDRIAAVDGRHLGVPATQRAIAAHRCAGPLTDDCRAATPVALTVQRGNRVLHLSVYPRYSKTAGRMLVGFGFGEKAKRFGVAAAAGVALHEMWKTTTGMITNVGKAFTSSKVRRQFRSIVGITEITHESVVAGLGYAVVILALLSLILAVFNLFPFLPLDGGHVLWSVAEKVRGRRISLAAMYRYSSVGIILLLFLVINSVGNDLSRIAG